MPPCMRIHTLHVLSGDTLAANAQQRAGGSARTLHELGDVFAGDGHTLDRAADRVALELQTQQCNDTTKNNQNNPSAKQRQHIIRTLAARNGTVSRGMAMSGGRTTGMTWVTPSPESMTVPAQIGGAVPR